MPVITAQIIFAPLPFLVFLLAMAHKIKHTSETIQDSGYRMIAGDSIPNGRKYEYINASDNPT